MRKFCTEEKSKKLEKEAVLRSSIRMFVGLSDPNPLVRDTDPDPNPSIILKQTTVVRKTLIPTVLWLLFGLLSLKNDVNVGSKSKQQNHLEQEIIFVAILKVTDENSRIRIR